MNILGVLENGLFALGQLLRFPVMTLLWICVAAALFMAGSTLIDFLARRRERFGFDVERWIRSGDVLGSDKDRRDELPRALRSLVLDAEHGREVAQLDDGGLEHLVLGHEEQMRKSLNGSRLLVRVGPSLGLIGTLIPMGTALAALASGNLEAMAGQMIVAFTTTIIGIACGTVAFVILSIRQQWVNATVREQRFLAERIAVEIQQRRGT